ncbi:MAG: tyrosine-type recombinase/integrase [Geobacteraceae bacterium]|nr:tyrosine-type recombinase/integrase [Geobacteraceae bacterium]
MTNSLDFSNNHYPNEWLTSVYSTNHSLFIPLPDNPICEAESLRTFFFPSAGALHFHQPSERRRILNRAADRLEASRLPGFEYVISYLYSKYRSNHSISSISQTGRILHSFLLFFNGLGRNNVEQISRKDVAQYVEQEQERGLKINSIRQHLHTVYGFVNYLVRNDILPADILLKKIRLRLLEILPKAIPAEDVDKILQAVTHTRDRALLLLLLHTGMRIGELLNLRLPDIVRSERKILLYVGEKNLHGRVVYYGNTAEKALHAWLFIRDPANEYLFYGYKGKSLSYAGARKMMKGVIFKAGLEHKGYCLHSLRHTYATNMLNAGLRLEVLQQLLGHLNIDMTLRYARISNLTQEESYFKAMALIEQGGRHEYDRVNPELQAVFEEKKFLSSHD